MSSPPPIDMPITAFGVLQTQNKYNAAAILEWTISLVYILFVASFFLDFIPAVHSKHNRFPTKEEMAQLHAHGDGAINGPSVSGGPTNSERHSNAGTYDSSRPLNNGSGTNMYMAQSDPESARPSVATDPYGNGPRNF